MLPGYEIPMFLICIIIILLYYSIATVFALIISHDLILIIIDVYMLWVKVHP